MGGCLRHKSQAKTSRADHSANPIWLKKLSEAAVCSYEPGTRSPKACIARP